MEEDKPTAFRGVVGEANYFRLGSTLHDRWLFVDLLGTGGFGQVFLARDLRDRIEVAIKTEQLAVKKKCLCMEVAVMRQLGTSQHCPYLVACGRTDLCRYIVMECLGMSLHDVLKRNPQKTLPIPVVCQLGLQSITAIREMHDAGFIHRDVKPANFSFGKHPKVANNLFIYDFGLARIHLVDGKPRKRRRRAGFKGTLRYASVSSHELRDLGRVDDLIPLFYACVEMVSGKLPWKGLADRDKIHEMKAGTGMEMLCGGMPPEFETMGKALYQANYKSKPRYDELSGLISSVLVRMRLDPNNSLKIPGLATFPSSFSLQV